MFVIVFLIFQDLENHCLDTFGKGNNKLVVFARLPVRYALSEDA